MTFQDVPMDLSEISLDSNPTLATDVVDLFCPEDARYGGAIAVLICDDQARLLQPIVVDQVPSDARPAEFGRFLGHILTATGPGGAIILAICHPDRQISDTDRAWHQVTIDQCRAFGVRLIGAYVAVPNHVMRLPDPVDATA